MSTGNDPFAQPARRRWIPAEMSRPPLLAPDNTVAAIRARYALLINPFYPKDPHASFGKHMLTPTLALTSFAATTPEHWEIRYWDENLLDGRPPFRLEWPRLLIVSPAVVSTKPRYFSYFNSPSASSRCTMFVTLA